MAGEKAIWSPVLLHRLLCVSGEWREDCGPCPVPFLFAETQRLTPTGKRRKGLFGSCFSPQPAGCTVEQHGEGPWWDRAVENCLWDGRKQKEVRGGAGREVNPCRTGCQSWPLPTSAQSRSAVSHRNPTTFPVYELMRLLGGIRCKP